MSNNNHSSDGQANYDPNKNKGVSKGSYLFDYYPNH